MGKLNSLNNSRFIIQLLTAGPNASLESIRRGPFRTSDCLLAKRRKMNMSATRSHSFMLARFKLEVDEMIGPNGELEVIESTQKVWRYSMCGISTDL